MCRVSVRGLKRPQIVVIIDLGVEAMLSCARSSGCSGSTEQPFEIRPKMSSSLSKGLRRSSARTTVKRASSKTAKRAVKAKSASKPKAKRATVSRGTPPRQLRERVHLRPDPLKRLHQPSIQRKAENRHRKSPAKKRRQRRLFHVESQNDAKGCCCTRSATHD
jgi:hypothetical protein